MYFYIYSRILRLSIYIFIYIHIYIEYIPIWGSFKSGEHASSRAIRAKMRLKYRKNVGTSCLLQGAESAGIIQFLTFGQHSPQV